MKRQINIWPKNILFSLILFLLGSLIIQVTKVTPLWAVTPITDSTQFIVDAGIFASPADDYDMLILREGFSASPVDLTPFNNPNLSYVGNNIAAFSNSNDYIQSVLIRLFDGGTGDDHLPIKLKGTLTFNGQVSILGIITDVVQDNPITPVSLQNSDLFFHDPVRHPYTLSVIGNDPQYLNKLFSAFNTTYHPRGNIYRELESSGGGADIVSISTDRKTITFEYQTFIGADDIRIILDYGDGLSDFPAGVTFDINLDILNEFGFHLGSVDYGEGIKLTGIPLTGLSSPQATYRRVLPDDVYWTHTKGRDGHPATGGDDDNVGIYYFVINDSIKDGTPNPDFYIYIMDADNSAVPSHTIGNNDIALDGLIDDGAGDTVFEYRLYGGPGASIADDSVNVTLADPNQGNPTTYGGTLIDINPDPSRTTLRTDFDSAILKDRDWTIIGVDMDNNPGDTNDVYQNYVGQHVYKLVVDGTIGCIASKPNCIAADWDRYQLAVSRSATDPNVTDGTTLFAYEMVFAGRPVGYGKTTDTQIYVPNILDDAMDIQTLDLDESQSSTTIDFPATSVILLPNGTVYGDTSTFEGGNQVYWNNSSSPLLWSSLNQGERIMPGEGFPSAKDGKTCGVGTETLCYNTFGNERGLWSIKIDPQSEFNPYALRACKGVMSGQPCERLPLIPTESNRAPQCLIVTNPAPPTGPFGFSVSFDASGSTDPDGDSIISYEWDYNYDGITFTTDATGINVSQAFTASSTVALRLTDSRSKTNDPHACLIQVTVTSSGTDTDQDGILDDGDGNGTVGNAPCVGGNTISCDDNCKTIANGPNEAGIPGVGNQADYDSDGVGDACDNCPQASNSNQINSDGDNYGDACDNCPYVTNQNQADTNGDGVGDACQGLGTDQDNDGVLDDGDWSGFANDHYCSTYYVITTNCDDNCKLVPNTDQKDGDGDYVGSACDNCSMVSNPKTNWTDIYGVAHTNEQQDSDLDGIGDACDNCPYKPNLDQADWNNNGIGDVCDPTCSDVSDPDNDGVPTCYDNCPGNYNPGQKDRDRDGIGDVCDKCNSELNADQEDKDKDNVQDACDNCPDTPNSGQEDYDGDGVGDVCDPCKYNPDPLCSGHRIEIEIHPETVEKNSSGIPIMVEVWFKRSSEHSATDVIPDNTFQAKMYFPGVLGNYSDPNCPPLSYMPGTIQYGSKKISMKFDRQAVEACVKPGEHVILRVTGTLLDGHEFTGEDDVRVRQSGSSGD